MKWLRRLLDSQAHHFESGGRLEKLYPLWEAQDSFLYTPGQVTAGASHVRDGLDLKRLMMTVVIALSGCVYMALHNTGYQANLAIARGAAPLDNWQTAAMQALGLGFAPDNLVSCLAHGGLYYLPILVVTFAVGGIWELLFAVVRKHELNEGFLVTGMLFPLVLPPTAPLWQVALGISFGVVVGKEIFGGTGMNVLNPALVARAFVFFAYPAEMSGDAVWIAADTATDAVSGATILADATLGGHGSDRRGGVRLLERVRRLRSRLDGRDLRARLPRRRGAADRHRRRVVADHGERAGGHRRDDDGPQRDRLGHQPVLRCRPGVAPAGRRLGVRDGLHGDRSGLRAVRDPRPLGLWLPDRLPLRPDPRREPGVS